MRAPATIVIPVWNAWKETQACLESLRPTLGVQDQVVVVDNGSTDATAARLGFFSWAEVVRNVENRGFAAACNQGAALARHDTLVFLHNDTILTGHWLNALLAPFADSSIGGTGPRSNLVDGPQVAEGASYLTGDGTGMRSFARAWEKAHRGATAPAVHLDGFCIAVRREAFLATGGFDESSGTEGWEDADLSRRLSAGGWQLRIVDGSYVHHSGHRTYAANRLDWFAQRERNRSRFQERYGAGADQPSPLVSACLIVKDEEENLPGCLASLAELADEVVIYDTGSTDRTVEIARLAGATVIEGYWDDDFSRARNVALAECRGDWIAWLDADETLLCDDIEGLRAGLEWTAPEIDAYSVPIENITGSGVGSMFVHSACRIFRRARCEWAGRLHEQVAGRTSHRPVDTSPLLMARIHHTGYTTHAMNSRGKAERNLRVAEAEVAHADGWDKGFSLTSLGRSYMTAGQADAALATCRQGAAETDNPITRRLALRTIVDALVALDRPEEALEALDELRAASDGQVLVNLLESNIRRHMGEHERALELLAVVDVAKFDDDGFEYDAAMFAQQRSESLAALERFSEAADVLLEVLAENSILDTHLGTLVEYLEHAGRPLSDLADALPDKEARVFLAQVLQLQDDIADRVVESCFERGRPDVVLLLATVATLARRLPVPRALVWSSRLRERGLNETCPLVYIAVDDRRSPIERAQAAAAGFRMFADDRLAASFPNIVLGATEEERDIIVAETNLLCPALLESAAVAAGDAP